MQASMADLPAITITTDGACKGNPGPGGWAAILQWNGHEKILSGAERHTTNNRMEMTAALKALEALKKPSEVTLVTDSKYLLEGMTKWIHGWKRNGWRSAAKHEVKNADLWKELDKAAAPHSIRWQWVRGHAGHEMNERADSLANEAIAGMLEARQS
jgi:ribonuclease HI